MKKIRIPALLLAAVMLFSMFGGCRPADNEPQTSVPSSTSQSSAATVETTKGYEGEMPVSEAPIKLKFMTHAGFAANMPAPDNDLLYYKMTQEKTNVEIEWDVVATDSYNEVLQAKLAAGQDLPDIMNLYVSANVLSSYKSGLYLPLNDLIEEYAYYTKKWWADGNDMYRQMWTQADGNIYSLNDYAMPDYNQTQLMYNTKWLEKLGKAVPQTVAEFEELLYAMKDVDFNGNGKNDEIILTGDLGNYNQLGFSWGLEIRDSAYGFQVGDDGKTLTCDYTDDRWREFLTFSNKLFTDNILDKEIALNTSSMMMEKIAADRVGIVIYHSSYAQNFSKLTSYGLNDPTAEIYTIGDPLEGPRGDKYMMYRVNVGADPCVITKACKYPVEAMKWLDYCFASDENLTLRYWGVEGTDYTVGADGRKTPILPTDGKTFTEHIYTYGGNQVPMCHRQDVNIKLATDVPWAAAAQQRLKQYFKLGVLETPMTEEEQKTYTAYRPDILNFVKEAEGLFISGENKLDDAGWNKYLSALDALHIKDLLAAYQSRYDRDSKS